MCNCLIKCLLEIKSKYEYEGKDFEADLVKFYSKMRKMVKNYSLNNFGPFELTEINTSTSPAYLPHIKETISNEKKLSRVGYDPVKEKVKSLGKNLDEWSMKTQGPDLGRLLLTTVMY